ncbi:GntR family transcriptional regulator [Puniceibacterium confluentis]|uniref:GntR family transcriptional regulator n=1 Tax=Puniceibacterium confluentis TaxID=1958944 RepID=UPI0011B65A17|nr:GntR family transcriptional regulator [Puniceibacterium confluentis]
MPKDGYFLHQDILDALRTRICLTPPEESFPLQESALGREFDVSRTPVRQVLQTLAREHLVDIRPSVGATVTRLSPSSKSECFTLYRDLTAIAATLAEGKPLHRRTTMEFASVMGILQSDPELNTELYVTLAVRIQMAVSLVIEDQILFDALLAAFWRVIRWRVQDLDRDPEMHWGRFLSNVRETADSTASGDPAHVLRTIAGVTDKMVTLQRTQP